MEPPPTTTIEPPPLPSPKVRLMCSYNGHITPRPKTNTLTYAGGETRIVGVDRRTSVASLTHHLSRTLYNNQPLTLKYQLPNEDLDSLISITTDEDLQNMLEEHDRVITPSRIRLFLFPLSGNGSGSLLLDPKSEMWFSDALKSSMIVSRGLSDGSGSGSLQESMVLETCSSFGSINSSLNNDDNNFDNKVKLESDNCGRIYHHQVIPEASVHMQQRNVNVSGYQIQQQPVQYVQTGSPHYVQYPTGQVPLSSYYPMYVPYQHQQQQQQQYQYQQQPNQAYPIYVMPMGPTDQSYNMSVPADLNGSVARPPLHTHIANANAGVVPERVAVVPQVTQSNIVTSHSAQPMGPVATPTTPTYENEYDNDLAYAQIYKSQPSAPVFPPQTYETGKKTEPVALSDP